MGLGNRKKQTWGKRRSYIYSPCRAKVEQSNDVCHELTFTIHARTRLRVRAISTKQVLIRTTQIGSPYCSLQTG
jgi:hypothetical protein